MDEGVVERREDVRNTKVALALSELGAELDGLLGLLTGLLGRLEYIRASAIASNALPTQCSFQTSPIALPK